jgi:hypothetical protein
MSRSIYTNVSYTVRLYETGVANLIVLIHGIVASGQCKLTLETKTVLASTVLTNKINTGTRATSDSQAATVRFFLTVVCLSFVLVCKVDGFIPSSDAIVDVSASDRARSSFLTSSYITFCDRGRAAMGEHQVKGKGCSRLCYLASKFHVGDASEIKPEERNGGAV